MIYWSLKKNSNFRRLKTRKILDKTKMFAKLFIRGALQFHTLIYCKMSIRSKMIFDEQEDKFTFLHTQQDMQKHVSAVLTAMIIIDNKKTVIICRSKISCKNVFAIAPPLSDEISFPISHFYLSRKDKFLSTGKGVWNTLDFM